MSASGVKADVPQRGRFRLFVANSGHSDAVGWEPPTASGAAVIACFDLGIKNSCD